MGDAVALTDYLRDYIWSIGVTQMRAATPEGTTNVPRQPSLPPAMPALKTGQMRMSTPHVAMFAPHVAQTFLSAPSNQEKR